MTQLVAKAVSGNPNRFVTLTHWRRKGLRAEDAAREIANAWRLVVKRWMRANPKVKPQYFCVFEATKQGWPHLHILWRGPWLSQKWLSLQMKELIASPIVWVELITGPLQAARYVAKYCGKAPHKFGSLKRYWSSQGYTPTLNTDAWKARRKDRIFRIFDDDIDGVFLAWTAEGLNPQVNKDWTIQWGVPP